MVALLCQNRPFSMLRRQPRRGETHKNSLRNWHKVELNCLGQLVNFVADEWFWLTKLGGRWKEKLRARPNRPSRHSIVFEKQRSLAYYHHTIKEIEIQHLSLSFARHYVFLGRQVVWLYCSILEKYIFGGDNRRYIARRHLYYQT